MKILIINPSDEYEIEPPLKVNVDRYTTLYDLMRLIHKERAAADLEPVYQCSYNSVPLLSVNLSTSLYKLLGKEEGEITLHVSSEVPKDAQQNLSLQIMPYVKSQSVKQESLSLFSSKPKSYGADQKKILGEALSTLPESLVNIVSEYRGDEEVKLSNYDSYLVVDLAAILPYPDLKNHTGYCILSAEFYTALKIFFGTVFDLGLHPDRRVTITMDTTKFQKFRFEDNGEDGNTVVRKEDQIYYLELELAKASIKPPRVQYDWYSEVGLIDPYEVIIHLSPENNVRGIYAYACNHNEIAAVLASAVECYESIFRCEPPASASEKVFSRELIHIDCSSLEKQANRNAQINDTDTLAAAFVCLMQKKIFGEDYVHEKHPEDEMDIQGIKISEYNPYEKIARDYFLENHKSSSETKWDYTNTLDEIIAHALLSQNSWSHWAKGSQTKRTLLMLLGQDDAWFRMQTGESLKNAILSHVQLQCAEIMNSNAAHQPKKFSH